MTAIAPMTFVTLLAWASLGFGQEAASASEPTQSVKEELRQAGQHVGNATRIAAERTKEGLRTAGEKVRTTATKTGKKLEQAGGSAKKKTKSVAKDVKARVQTPPPRELDSKGRPTPP
ncbi:MAG TPA: hypothetical protein VF947_07505 [Myxococcales bacterium]